MSVCIIKAAGMTQFRTIPGYEAFQELAKRVPEVNPSAVNTCLRPLRASGEVM